ncbi:MAG: metal ABC transporter substrate-binding protein [Deinococcales bacterium]
MVASIHPYADLLEQIGGTRITVVQLLPSGASPHTFDPTPSQARTVAQADLVVMNGGVDDWLRQLVAAVAPKTRLLVVRQAIQYQPIQGTDGAGTNPHIWLDPKLMEQAVPVMVDALAAVDPADRATFEANGASLIASLEALDRELAAELAPLRGQAFVPFHDAWPYFARHYGLDLIASIEPSPGREPSPRHIAAAVAEIRKSGTRAVFGERQLNPRPAEVVAQAAGVRLALLDPIGDTGESYQDLMRANVATIVHALHP